MSISSRFPALVLASLLPLLSGCVAGPYVPSQEQVPEPPRELRAAWIATVHNIDWPSAPGLPVAEQQRELLALLDRAQSVGLNALVLQVRPTCDALYASELEPWSRYLTGTIGQAPEPFYDPLAFAISAAHARGLELHAWFNPYRARPGKDDPRVAKGHVTDPDSPLNHALRPYGELLLLDPGLPEVRAHSTRVILDVVERYDLDAVHMDDYFYPYPDERPDGSVLPFPDEATFAARGEGLSRSDWRRRNVDTFVRELGPAVHGLKPWVKVGIAPFGIWRPKHPESVRGMDAFEALSADTRRWLREGWVDYLAPQLYWGTNFPEQRFGDLASWWEAQNPLGRHLWPGISSRWIKSERDPSRDAGEILRQIEIVRATAPNVRPGHIHWNLSALVEDRDGIVGALQAGPYREGALVPASPWLAGEVPGPLEEVSIEEVSLKAGRAEGDGSEGASAEGGGAEGGGARGDGARGDGAGCVLRWRASAGTRWVALQIREAGQPWRLVGVRRAEGSWSLSSRPAAIALRPMGTSGAIGPAQVWERAE